MIYEAFMEYFVLKSFFLASLNLRCKARAYPGGAPYGDSLWGQLKALQSITRLAWKLTKFKRSSLFCWTVSKGESKFCNIDARVCFHKTFYYIFYIFSSHLLYFLTFFHHITFYKIGTYKKTFWRMFAENIRNKNLFRNCYLIILRHFVRTMEI